jgi:predicted metalloprotease with PDZ domain
MFQSKSLIATALLGMCCARAIDAAEIAAPRDIPYPGTLTLSVDLTDNRRLLDDFARAFFGIKDKSDEVVTYTVDDIVAALSAVSSHDWKAFLSERLDSHAPAAPLDGLKRSGWQLIELLVKTFDRYRTVRLPYFEGLRYPHLERIDGTADRLTDILKPRT